MYRLESDRGRTRVGEYSTGDVPTVGAEGSESLSHAAPRPRLPGRVPRRSSDTQPFATMYRLLLATVAVALALPVSAQTRRSPSSATERAAPPLAPPTPPARGGNPVADSSFEASFRVGSTPPVTVNPEWESQSSQFGSPLCDSACTDGVPGPVAAPRTGDWFTWFGGTNPMVSESARISQAVSLPTPTATLRFWMRMEGSSFSDGTLVVNLADEDELNVDSTVAVFSFDDLPDFPEDQPYQQVVLPIRSTGVPQLLNLNYGISRAQPILSFFVDDVKLGPPVPGALLAADGRQFPRPAFERAVASDSLVFGDVQTDGSVTRTVRLTNLGADPATVGDITFSGTPGVTVAVDRSGLPATIPPGGQASFRATLRTARLGPVAGTLSVASNSPGSPATLAVTATGISTSVQTFCAGSPVDLPAGPPSVYAGLAAPYPSTVTVSGVTRTVFDVDVRLVGLSHGVPRHLDIGLVHPQGPSLVLMSDVGRADPVSGITLTLSDEAANALPPFAQLQTGPYRPTNLSVGDDPFPAPAPAIPTDEESPRLSVFDGRDPNGVWRLFGRDDEAIGPDFDDQGGLADWCLDLEVANAVGIADDPAGAPAQLTVAPNPARRAATVRLAGVTGAATVALYDALGRRVALVHDGPVASEASFALDVSRLPAGVYVVHAAGEGVAMTERLTVVR